MTTAAATKQQRENPRTLLLIGIFKLAKGLGLAAIGFGALRLLHHDIAETVEHWVNILRVDPDNHFVHGVISRVLNIQPKQLKEISAGTFFYAALLLTEGIGLLLHQHWAEYFTIVSTAALIPLEVYEIAEHVSVLKILVLLVNIAIVWYLVARVRTRRQA